VHTQSNAIRDHDPLIVFGLLVKVEFATMGDLEICDQLFGMRALTTFSKIFNF
jgi:hypothetical protein